ncbi:MAG: AAA family ATPase [Acidimicrobiales bacterium]
MVKPSSRASRASSSRPRVGKAADHLLFGGPPGLGKTTLASIVATELGANLHITSGLAIERAATSPAFSPRLEAGDVLFIDEIHRLRESSKRSSIPRAEDLQIDVARERASRPQHSIRSGAVHPRWARPPERGSSPTASRPLRFAFRLEFYSAEDLTTIVERAAAILDVAIDDQGSFEVARRSRGTPRIANRLLRRVRDFAEVRSQGDITRESASDGLTLFGTMNAARQDRPHTARKSASTSTVAWLACPPRHQRGRTHRDRGRRFIEPFLIQQGLIMRTPRGRVACQLAWRHLDLPRQRTSPITTATRQTDAMFDPSPRQATAFSTTTCPSRPLHKHSLSPADSARLLVDHGGRLVGQPSSRQRPVRYSPSPATPSW